MLTEFLATAILIELTPGPNMAWLALLGASRGRMAALATVAGVALGLAIAGTAAAVGVSALISTTPWLFNALRWAGSLYLLYLAWDAWHGGTDGVDEKNDPSMSRYFLQGLGSNMLNPKAYLVYAAVLPQFINVPGNVLNQLIILTSLYVFVATAIHATIAMLGGSLNGFFADTTSRKMLGRIFALILTAVAVWFFYSTGLKSS
jgi:threonine/homoserine/homoserine lactone efflux protein